MKTFLKTGVYIYIYIGNRKKTTLSSRQACFVIAHSSGDFNYKSIHNHRLYTLRLHCWRKFKFKCLVFYVATLCFCDGKKIQVRYVS